MQGDYNLQHNNLQGKSHSAHSFPMESVRKHKHGFDKGEAK